MNSIPYEVMKLLGWATLILVSLATTFFILIQLNKYLSKKKSNSPIIKKIQHILRKIIPFIKSYHYAFGLTALFTGLSHGFLLLRSVRLHSGYILWSFILLQALLGVSMKLLRNRKVIGKIRLIHRYTMFLTITMMLFHVITMQ